MRWFSLAWDDSEPDDRQAVIDDYYGRHLSELSDRMPPALRALSQLNLHDGQFAAWDYDGGMLTIRLLIGDLQVGYRWLDLRYIDADVDPSDVAGLRLLSPEVEVLHDEIDQNGARRWEHRYLLWPEAELTIRFVSLELEMSQAKARDRH